MEHYISIKISEEVNYYVYRQAMDQIMRRVHGALKEHGEGKVGLSFPGYYKDREHGSKSVLGRDIHLVSDDFERLSTVASNLNTQNILDRGLLTVGGIKAVPEGCERATFKRRRNEERSIRRQDRKESDVDFTYPFFHYGKRVGGSQYKISVQKSGPVDDESAVFSSYGLCSMKSVPVIFS